MSNKIDGVGFPFANGTKEEATKLQKQVTAAKKKRAALRKKLQAAVGKTAIASAQKAYVASKQVRFAALIDAAKRLEEDEREEISAYWDRAEKLKIWEPIEEDVIFRLKKKPTGGYRGYCAFGVMHKAAQIMVNDMLRELFVPAEFIFDVRGRGVPKAVKTAKALIANGLRHGMHLDVKKYYDSFHHSAIMDPAIQIDADIKSATVLGKQFSLKNDFGSGPSEYLLLYSSLVASAGIPQGSAVSPLIAAFFMSKLNVSSLPVGVSVLVYADDLLLLADDPSKLEPGREALSSALAELLAGDFILAIKDQDETPHSFRYLGHDFSIDAAGALTLTVSEERLNQFSAETIKRANKILDWAQKSGGTYGTLSGGSAYPVFAADKVMEHAVRIKSWLLAYTEAGNIDELEEMFFDDIEQLCDQLGLSNAKTIWAKAKASEPMEYEGY